WDVASRSVVRSLEGHRGIAWGACFAPDGKSLATAGADASARTWDVPSERALHVFRGHRQGPSGQGVLGLAGLPDGRRFAPSGEDGTVRLWPWRRDDGGSVLFTMAGIGRSVAVSPDGRLVAACGADCSLYLCDRTAAPALRLRAWRLFGAGGGWV